MIVSDATIKWPTPADQGYLIVSGATEPRP
jgi:hypothetical protein